MIWLIGLIFVLFGLILILSAFTTQKKPFNEKIPDYPEFAEKEKRYGGLVLIGPIPIVFGDARLAIIAMVLAITLMLLSFIFIFGWLN